jgi:diguanylate cyclase (GGDEF)-like protein
MLEDLRAALVNCDLDVEARNAGHKLAFSPPLEEAYRNDTAKWRRRHYRRTALLALVSYNAFLLVDAMVVPDVIVLSGVLHLLVVTPLMMLAALLLSQPQPHQRSEWIGSVMPLIYLAQVEIVFLSSRAQSSEHYQYLTFFVIMFSNAILRLQFRSSVLVSFTCIVIHTLIAFKSPNLSVPGAVLGTIGLLATAYVTLLSQLIQEREYRRSWLRRRDVERRAQDLTSDNAKLSRLTRIDPLTGVTNRRGFELAVEQFHSAHADALTPFSIIMIDVDRFKSYNDRYGHGAGDACLKAVADIAVRSLRGTGDILARFGGEEFVVFLPHCRLAEGSRSAERIRRALVSAAMEHQGKHEGLVVTASFGVAEGRLSGMSALHETINAADAALYDAKNAGRNRVEPPPEKKRPAPPMVPGDDPLRATG